MYRYCWYSVENRKKVPTVPNEVGYNFTSGSILGHFFESKKEEKHDFFVIWKIPYFALYRKNPIYVFPEEELRGLSPNFYIHVSVSDLYIPRIGPHIWLQQNRPTQSWKYINLSQIYECRI
jgi:hypothetical protein